MKRMMIRRSEWASRTLHQKGLITAILRQYMSLTPTGFSEMDVLLFCLTLHLIDQLYSLRAPRHERICVA